MTRLFATALGMIGAIGAATAIPAHAQEAGGDLLKKAIVAAQAKRQSRGTGTRVTEPKAAEITAPGTKDQQDLRVIRQYAACTFARSANKVGQTLLLDPGSEGAALNELASDRCLVAGEMRFDSALFRGALFSELLRQRAASDPSAWELPVQALDLVAAAPADANMERRTHQFMMELANCLASDAESAMRETVLRPVGSAEQEAAFATIIPLLGPCLPEGMTVKLNKMTLEHTFAEYLYRSTPAAGATEMPDA